MEAMATGMPVISTRHAGIAEMISHGETGILVNEFDYIGMADEMIGLVRDKERMKTIGRAAAASIRSNKLVTDHMAILSEELARFIEG
jgi:glycosyltransferase involved in cell wall biosynthesis